MDGWWAKAKQRNSLRSTSKTPGPQRKGQKVGRLFRTGTSWDRAPHQMLTLTSGCSHLSQLLGLWAISGESQGGMLGTGWEEDEAETSRLNTSPFILKVWMTCYVPDLPLWPYLTQPHFLPFSPPIPALQRHWYHFQPCAPSGSLHWLFPLSGMFFTQVSAKLSP